MKASSLIKRISAVLAAVSLTIAGAWYAAGRARENVRQTAAGTGDRQVIILDAGHGAST